MSEPRTKHGRDAVLPREAKEFHLKLKLAEYEARENKITQRRNRAEIERLVARIIELERELINLKETQNERRTPSESERENIKRQGEGTHSLS